MSLLARLERLDRLPEAALVPLRLEGEDLGRLDQALAQALARAVPDDLQLDADGALDLVAGGRAALDARAERIVEALERLRRLPPRRGERYAIRTDLGSDVLFAIERAAVDVLGLPAFGVHLNAFVPTDDGLGLWVARRAMTKPTFPGALDHIVAGGLPEGIDLRDNLDKEAHEEAGLEAGVLADARCLGELRYTCAVPQGVRNDTVFVYDVDLPGDVVPRPTDGEVAEFFLWSTERVLDALRGDADFKFNVGPAILASFLERGLLDDDPEREAIAAWFAGRM